ncbi:flavin-containing monooxygenase [Gordonia rhizosphera]|uniref:Putative steroid monooxygenase n=1 Tax=Gordonia rhizosphera NBRC 16068 TaxID=1108045 RepID=K6V0W7_9ACTN|nr:NAD(P)/FAD-dependent oxidoreductase [Gordonia rhizosphera]GAB89543.1 putative steroid monooxygenase [Gordonia rhizosphera NBRC 16068]
MATEITDTADAVIIGAGFAGMYALHRLRDEFGYSIRVFDRADDVGGTWYWNTYPGARCDVESVFYSYSFSEELEQEWTWTERYPTQPEILAYANHVADKFDLRRSITFETSVAEATFDESNNRWLVTTDRGETVTATYLITAVGCLSEARIPDFEGIESFGGRILHTGHWPRDGVDFDGLRVAVIGTGSSGIQAIPEIARDAKTLNVFQRTPHFALPAGNRPLATEEIDEVKANYRRYRAICKVSPSGVPIVPPIGSVLSLPDDVGRAEMNRRWENGGTMFMTAFTDTSRNEDANAVLASFVRERIRDIVADPDTAESLTPHGYPIGAKRICLGTDYYATYNRDNVSLVDVRDNPIERITERGIVAGGNEYELDVIIFATGYDAMTGALTAIDIRGVNGLRLRDEWAAGPRTYLGIASAQFPNMFMITGPGSPSVLVNVIVSIEQHVDWMCDLLSHAEKQGISRIEADLDAQNAWVLEVNDVASRTMFVKANSWYLGANVPGKARVFMPYAGGIGPFRERCDKVAAEGYTGFTLTDTATAPIVQASA